MSCQQNFPQNSQQNSQKNSQENLFNSSKKLRQIITKPFILSGKIMHARTWPKKNIFNYRSTYFSIPLTKTDLTKSRFFSLNRRNFYSINDQDYVNKQQIWQILEDHKIQNIDEIVLVTQAKTAFYVFNPVSFFLCFKKDQLIAVFAEVNNRSSQTHSYLIFNRDFSEIRPNQWLEAEKKFYVSPFLNVEGEYRFKTVVTDEELSFYINYLVEGKLILSTYLCCSYNKFCDLNLVKFFFLNGLDTFKTTTLIHYQALKLLIKGIKFIKPPKEPKNKITLSK